MEKGSRREFVLCWIENAVERVDIEKKTRKENFWSGEIERRSYLFRSFIGEYIQTFQEEENKGKKNDWKKNGHVQLASYCAPLT